MTLDQSCAKSWCLWTPFTRIKFGVKVIDIFDLAFDREQIYGKSIIMCTECICGRMSTDTLDRYSIDNSAAPRLTSRSTLHRHLGRRHLGRQSTNFRSMHMSQSTLGRLSTDCWSSVDEVSIGMSIDIWFLLWRASRVWIKAMIIFDLVFNEYQIYSKSNFLGIYPSPGVLHEYAAHPFLPSSQVYNSTNLSGNDQWR